MLASFRKLRHSLKRQQGFMQAAASLLLLAYVLSWGANSSWLKSLQGMQLRPFLVCILLHLIQIQLSAEKWFSIAKKLQLKGGKRNYVLATWIASTLNQALPTSVFGEGQRFFYVKAGNIHGRVLLSQLLDRISVHLIWAIALVPAIPWYLAPSKVQRFTYLYLALIFVLAMSLWKWARGRTFVNKLRENAALILHPSILVQSLAVALLVPAGLYFAGLSMGHTMVWQELLRLSPFILLALAVPFFFSGWGIREAVLVYFASPLGLAKSEAVASSLSYGLAGMLAAPLGLCLTAGSCAYSAVLRKWREKPSLGEGR